MELGNEFISDLGADRLCSVILGQMEVLWLKELQMEHARVLCPVKCLLMR